METPRDDDFITNSDESKMVPDENPEPLEGIKTDEPDNTTENTTDKKTEDNSSNSNQKPVDPKK